MSLNSKMRLIWGFSAFVVLIIIFYVLRHFTWLLHLNRDWNFIMFIFSSIVLFLAILFLKKRLMVLAVLGYPTSFIIGTTFNTYSLDPGGGSVSNWWSLWTMSYLVIILMAVVWEFLEKKRRTKGEMHMNIREKALEVINRCKIGMIGNVDELGSPQIKALMKTRNEGLKEFWFCSNTSAKRTSQIEKDGNTCLYFYEGWEGVMLRGVAELSYDDEMRKSFWEDFMLRYYPEGPLDPDFVLIKFTATSGNYYHKMKNEDFVI